LRVEPRKVEFERAFANPEDIRPLTSQHPADEAAAMSRAAHDLLDRGSLLSLLENGGVGVLAPQIAFILDALGGVSRSGLIVAAPTADRI
jgi:hypothetical protein